MEGHSIDKRQLRFVISSCRLSGVLQLDTPTLGARGFFCFFVLFWIAASPLTAVAKQNKQNRLAPRVGCTRKEAQVHADMRLVNILNHELVFQRVQL